MKISKSAISLISSLFLMATFLLWGEFYLSVDSTSNRIVSFEVQKGEGAKDISVNLKEQGLIKHSSMFRVYALFTGTSKKLQAGKYELSTGLSVSAIVKKLSQGDVVKQKITIIDGWDLQDIAEYFEEQNICAKDEFLELTKRDFSNGLDFLDDKPKNRDLEGYIFPDTYEIIPGTSPENIIRKILSTFNEKLTAEMREEIIKQKKSIFEIVTMASIIEKEIKSLEDKKLVSGIFWKRIKTGMALQSCATVVYITGRDVTLSDIGIDSPYNTYKYPGLPFGPISSPGLDSIIAAIYPVESEYLYYLSAKDGTTIFSKTYKEHSRAIDKYLK